ncbi:MAG: hypothetical protein PUC65_09165 [Clostridiales bacterium]|nr:hypothetical protein [Clostridiales bacterium]
MPISPIEVASFIPKSQEASQMKSIEQQKPAAEQLAFADKFNSEIKKNSEKTVPPTKTDNPEFRYDAKEKGNNPYYYQQRKKKKKDSECAKREELPKEHHGIDIKI